MILVRWEVKLSMICQKMKFDFDKTGLGNSFRFNFRVSYFFPDKNGLGKHAIIFLDPKPPIYYFEAKFLKASDDKYIQEVF